MDHITLRPEFFLLVDLRDFFFRFRVGRKKKNAFFFLFFF